MGNERMEGQPAITDAEVFCVRAVSEAMDAAGMHEGQQPYETVKKRMVELLTLHREEVRSMYASSKQMLKKWVMRESGAENVVAFRRLEQLGLTGDIMHDLKMMEKRR